MDIHSKVLKKFGINKEYIVEVVIEHAYHTLDLEVTITTYNQRQVTINIHKDVAISGDVKRPWAETSSYTYHARDGRTGLPIIRYCSPDRNDGKTHRSFHHKHTYDDYGENKKHSPKVIPGQEWPHVDEFLKEVFEEL